MAERGLRRHDRTGESAPVQVMWKDRSGNDRLLNGRTVDVSQDGMRLELKERIEEGTFVNFRVDVLKLHGTASVRRCVHKGARYMVGLQFTGGLKWKAEAAPKDAPKGG
jgi:hypothetical protein